MVVIDVSKSDTSNNKLVFERIRIKRLNVVIMTIAFHRWDKYRRNGNVGMVISYFMEHARLCNSSTMLH